MKKILKWGAIVFVGLIVIGVVAGKGGSTNTTTGSNAQNQPQTESTQVEPMKVTVKEIADDFDSNQVAAEEKWNGKYVEFSAEITNITDSGLSFSNIASKQFSLAQISCRTTDKQQLISVKNGDTVTVRGTVGKQSLGVIDVSNCQIVK